MMNRTPLRKMISLAELTFSFVPFGLLLAAALLLPEVVTPGGTPNLNWLDDVLEVNDPAQRPVPKGTPLLALNRAVLTIWVSTILLIPALCLSALPARMSFQSNFALLFWTFSYLAYLVHFYYAAFVIFGGVAGTFEHMRHPIAATNFFLTAWWTLDVLVAWIAPLDRAWVRWERAAAQGFVFLVYFVTELFLRPTSIRYLGSLLMISVLVCLLVRMSRIGGDDRTTDKSLS